MTNYSGPILSCEQIGKIKLLCKIDLDKLLPTKNERHRFDDRWKAFLASDKSNPNIFKIQGNKLEYKSEQLLPTKTDKRPPLLLVLGNPASHSVEAGMFFSFERDGKEHRFWKNILKPAGILVLPEIDKLPLDKMNCLRKQHLLELNYDGPFRIGLCVFISIPSAPGDKWGGVAGVQKLIGTRALRRLKIEESNRIRDCAKRLLGKKGKIAIFQKNAWNALRSSKDPEYRIDLAKKGKLRGSLKHAPLLEILGVPPTRLSGPCHQVLKLLTSASI